LGRIARVQRESSPSTAPNALFGIQALPTTPPAATLPSRRSSRRVFLPSAILGVVIVAWSGFWWYACTRVQGEWDNFVARQAELGRQITCGDQGLAGYPFRLEMHCGGPQVVSTKPGQAFSLTLGDLNAVAQVYQPNKAVLEAKGPLTLIDNDGSKITASWQSAEASMAIWTSGPQNADVVIKNLDASANRGGEALPLFSGTNIEAHIRVAEGANAAPGAYDLVAKADAAAIPLLDARLGNPAPLSAQVQGTITKMDLRPQPLPERLRTWAAEGGTLTIVLAQVNRGPTSVKATGTVALDTEGRPAGDLVMALAGVNELTNTLSQSGLVPGKFTSLIGVGLQMLGKPSNIDGKAAVEVPLKLNNGRVSIGAFPAGKLPSLF
jgi:hypothetical protein